MGMKVALCHSSMSDRHDQEVVPFQTEESEIAVELAECDTEEDSLPPTNHRHVSTTLPISAKAAFNLFCSTEAVPYWMSIVRSTRVISQYANGLPKRVAYVANLKRSCLGYSLYYAYEQDSLACSWSTAKSASTQMYGRASFQDLGSDVCMMNYALHVQAQPGLPAWNESMFNGHPASSVLGEFREFVRGNKASL